MWGTLERRSGGTFVGNANVRCCWPKALSSIWPRDSAGVTRDARLYRCDLHHVQSLLEIGSWPRAAGTSCSC